MLQYFNPTPDLGFLAFDLPDPVVKHNWRYMLKSFFKKIKQPVNFSIEFGQFVFVSLNLTPCFDLFSAGMKFIFPELFKNYLLVGQYTNNALTLCTFFRAARGMNEVLQQVLLYIAGGTFCQMKLHL